MHILASWKRKLKTLCGRHFWNVILTPWTIENLLWNYLVKICSHRNDYINANCKYFFMKTWNISDRSNWVKCRENAFSMNIQHYYVRPFTLVHTFFFQNMSSAEGNIADNSNPSGMLTEEHVNSALNEASVSVAGKSSPGNKDVSPIIPTTGRVFLAGKERHSTCIERYVHTFGYARETWSEKATNCKTNWFGSSTTW